MKELSLHILDIAQNSIAAGAGTIRISCLERGNSLTLTVEDDGPGMEPDLLARASDPFTTTRKTRPVGLGLPFLRLSAELTGGSFGIESAPGKGTTVTAQYNMNHIDALPLGDLAASVAVLIQGAPGLEIIWTHRKDDKGYTLDTGALRAELGEVPLDAPEVVDWIRAFVSEQEAALTSSIKEGEGDEKPGGTEGNTGSGTNRDEPA